MTWGYQSPHYEDITRSTNPFWRNTQVEPPGPIVHLDWSGWRERDNLPGFRGNWQAVLPDGDLVNSPVNISASDYNNVPFRERAYMNAFEIATNLVREAYPNARIG
jgi:hypothetical protein